MPHVCRLASSGERPAELAHRMPHAAGRGCTHQTRVHSRSRLGAMQCEGGREGQRGRQAGRPAMWLSMIVATKPTPLPSSHP